MYHKKGKYFRLESVERYGTACINCGDTENIEWHHVVPLCIGGYDKPSNIVPLCAACHKAVTDHELLLKTFGRRYVRYKGGRKQQVFEGSDAIFDDYVNCRITSKEAGDRLGKGSRHWVEVYAFRDFKKAKKIKSIKNNLGMIVFNFGVVKNGQTVGMITYEDGTEKTITWDEKNKALSGRSSVPTESNPKVTEEILSKVCWTGKRRGRPKAI